MEFEWDPRKAAENEAKHGVTFELAKTVFDDPNLLLTEDADHSAGERRYFAFGKVGGGILTVRFTVRAERVRIIGAGYWRKGKEFYEKTHRVRG